MRLISADRRWLWNGREWKPQPKAMNDESGADAPADIEHPAPAEPLEVVKDMAIAGSCPAVTQPRRQGHTGRCGRNGVLLPAVGASVPAHQPGSTPQERQHLRLDADIACADEEIHALPGEFATGLSLGRSVSGAAEPA